MSYQSGLTLLFLAPLAAGCFRARVKESEICQPPKSGSLICLYRNTQAGHWDNVDVVLDGKSIGPLENDHYVEVTVKPGDHLVRVYSAGHEGPSGALDVILTEGQVKVLKVDMQVGFAGGSAELSVDESKLEWSRREISADCRAQPPVNRE